MIASFFLVAPNLFGVTITVTSMYRELARLRWLNVYKIISKKVIIYEESRKKKTPKRFVNLYFIIEY